MDIRACLLTAVLLAVPAKAFAEEWQAVEKIETYAVTGKTGAELYASIGERGPKVGGSFRSIAQTNFKLTWTRKYDVQGNACVLVTARPKLIITYSLPKASGKLPASTKQKWDVFVAGVRKHELVHGDHIKDMVRKIEAQTVGLTVPDDPGCRAIRTEMTKRLGALSQAQRQQSRDFDRLELSNGGNVHQLILNLVNGN